MKQLSESRDHFVAVAIIVPLLLASCSCLERALLDSHGGGGGVPEQRQLYQERAAPAAVEVPPTVAAAAQLLRGGK